MTEYAEVLGVKLDNPEPIADLAPGDLVTVGVAKRPIWQVISIHHDRVWMFRTDAPWIDGVSFRKRLWRSIEVTALGAAA